MSGSKSDGSSSFAGFWAIIKKTKMEISATKEPLVKNWLAAKSCSWKDKQTEASIPDRVLF